MATPATTTTAARMARRTMRRRRAACAAPPDCGGRRPVSAGRESGRGRCRAWAARRAGLVGLDGAMRRQGTHRAEDILAMVDLDPGIGEGPPHHVDRGGVLPEDAGRHGVDANGGAGPYHGGA